MSTYLTVADIQRIHRRDIQRIYWLAHRDQWRRTRTKPVGYWAEDVEATMARDTLSDAA